MPIAADSKMAQRVASRSRRTSSRRAQIMTRPNHSGLLLAVLTLSVGPGCGTSVKRHPVPEHLAVHAYVPGLDNMRIIGFEHVEDGAAERSRIFMAQNQASGLFDQPQRVLAISGGGSNGAFGAGLLVGWTIAGDRPEFNLVSGISTGALIAPLPSWVRSTTT